MKPKGRNGLFFALWGAVAALWLLPADRVLAHCDTMGGPVITEARIALANGDLTPILKWVRSENEPEIRAAFALATTVRTLGPEARELADRSFLETLVRVHRAGEGAPYTGLKDGPVDPVAAMADQALADGAADDLAARIAAHLTGAMREKFERAHAASLVKDRDVEAGREFVEAYVDYMHYVEGVHAAIAATSSHDHGAGKGDAAAHEHQPVNR